MYIPTEIWRGDGVGIGKKGKCSEDAQTYAALNNHINILSKGWGKKSFDEKFNVLLLLCLNEY